MCLPLDFCFLLCPWLRFPLALHWFCLHLYAVWTPKNPFLCCSAYPVGCIFSISFHCYSPQSPKLPGLPIRLSNSTWSNNGFKKKKVKDILWIPMIQQGSIFPTLFFSLVLILTVLGFPRQGPWSCWWMSCLKTGYWTLLSGNGLYHSFTESIQTMTWRLTSLSLLHLKLSLQEMEQRHWLPLKWQFLSRPTLILCL